MAHIQYIKDEEHHDEVLALFDTVKHRLWLATANLKDISYKDEDGDKNKIIDIFESLVERKVEVRIICSRPTNTIETELYKSALLTDTEYFKIKYCYRNHMKMIVFDQDQVYIGSANMTPAGIGGRIEDCRNFEAGILTDAPMIVSDAIDHFSSAWNPDTCSDCNKMKRQKCTTWQDLRTLSKEERRELLPLEITHKRRRR